MLSTAGALDEAAGQVPVTKKRKRGGEAGEYQRQGEYQYQRKQEIDPKKAQDDSETGGSKG